MNRTSGNLVGLLIVISAAVVLILTIVVGSDRFSWVFGKTTGPAIVQVAIPKAPVAVRTVGPEMIEIIDVRYGILEPLEKYRFTFDTSGMIDHFGANADGKPLDIGDYVKQGQILAQLDQRRLAAQLRETKSRLEKAEDDMRRADQRQQRNVITADEYQSTVANLDIARAQVKIAETRLGDATLVSRADGVIAKREANLGQAVGPQQAVFEVHQIDRLLLAVEVPESRIPGIRPDQTVHLTLRSSDARGRQMPPINGKVYRVSPSADERTGMFKVEVMVDNSKGLLRAGQIAAARIVLDRVEGFRLPEFAAVIREGERLIFAVGKDGCAHRFVLQPFEYLDQRGDLILFQLPEKFRTVIVRGQHRLVDGREVEIIRMNPNETPHIQPDVEVSADSSPTTSSAAN